MLPTGIFQQSAHSFLSVGYYVLEKGKRGRFQEYYFLRYCEYPFSSISQTNSEVDVLVGTSDLFRRIMRSKQKIT